MVGGGSGCRGTGKTRLRVWLKRLGRGEGGAVQDEKTVACLRQRFAGIVLRSLKELEVGGGRGRLWWCC